MKRSSGIKRLGYEALRRLDNLRYRARRLSLFQGVATQPAELLRKGLGKLPGSAAHPCLLASVSRSLPETTQARMGGAPRQFALPCVREIHA